MIGNETARFHFDFSKETDVTARGNMTLSTNGTLFSSLLSFLVFVSLTYLFLLLPLLSPQLSMMDQRLKYCRWGLQDLSALCGVPTARRAKAGEFWAVIGCAPFRGRVRA